MWTVILIVCLAFAMMLGPIMIMQPSKRQRRLAKLRDLALVEGMKVKMKVMPDKSARAGESVPLYYQPWSDRKPLKDTWLLARQPFAHGLHFLDEWDWTDDRRATPEWQDVLKRALPTLPASVVAVEAGGHSVGVCWLESTGEKTPEQAVADIATWLRNFIAEVPLPEPDKQ
jgi:hypothetical protein